jgi:hypothetical protein
MKNNNNNKSNRSVSKKNGGGKKGGKGGSSKVTVQKGLAAFKRTTATSNIDGTITVRRREMISDGMDISASPSLIFTMQPGTMHWLSAIASRYEYYEVVSARLTYQTYSASASGGMVIMGVDYDVTDTTPANADSLMNGTHCTMGVKWADQTLNIITSRIEPKRKYTCGGGYPTGADPKFYDAFNVFALATNGSAGYYWLDYVVRFSSPQIAWSVAGSIDGITGSTIVADGAGDEYIETPVVAGDGNAPVAIETPDAADVAAGLNASAKAFKLPPNAERILSVLASSLVADATAGLGLKTNGVTATPIQADFSNAAQTAYSSLWSLVAGNAGGTVQPYRTPGTQSLSSMYCDWFSCPTASIV